MSKTRQMQQRDARMFGHELVRKRVYRGKDKTLLREGDIAITLPKDHGARPLLGKFSTFNLSRLTPEQRRVMVEQIRYELSLPADQLNDYLSQRYSEEDMMAIWELLNKEKIPGYTKPRNKGQKRRISNRKRKPETQEQKDARIAKMLATRKRNKNNPNHISYGTLKSEFMRMQKLVAARTESKLTAMAAVYNEPVIAKQVRRRTSRLERENQQLREYLRQNNLPLPGTKKAKIRREASRSHND